MIGLMSSDLAFTQLFLIYLLSETNNVNIFFACDIVCFIHSKEVYRELIVGFLISFRQD